MRPTREHATPNQQTYFVTTETWGRRSLFRNERWALSYRAKKELASNLEIWQKGFSDHRIRDGSDYRQHVIYIRQNPVRKNLCDRAEEYRYSSAYPGFKLDQVPRRLKPLELGTSIGAAEAAPFQNNSDISGPKGAPVQTSVDHAQDNSATRLQNKMTKAKSA